MNGFRLIDEVSINRLNIIYKLKQVYSLLVIYKSRDYSIYRFLSCCGELLLKHESYLLYGL